MSAEFTCARLESTPGNTCQWVEQQASPCCPYFEAATASNNAAGDVSCSSCPSSSKADIPAAADLAAVAEGTQNATCLCVDLADEASCSIGVTRNGEEKLAAAAVAAASDDSSCSLVVTSTKGEKPSAAAPTAGGAVADDARFNSGAASGNAEEPSSSSAGAVRGEVPDSSRRNLVAGCSEGPTATSGELEKPEAAALAAAAYEAHATGELTGLCTWERVLLSSRLPQLLVSQLHAADPAKLKTTPAADELVAETATVSPVTAIEQCTGSPAAASSSSQQRLCSTAPSSMGGCGFTSHGEKPPSAIVTTSQHSLASLASATSTGSAGGNSPPASSAGSCMQRGGSTGLCCNQAQQSDCGMQGLYRSHLTDRLLIQLADAAAEAMQKRKQQLPSSNSSRLMRLGRVAAADGIASHFSVHRRGYTAGAAAGPAVSTPPKSVDNSGGDLGAAGLGQQQQQQEEGVDEQGSCCHLQLPQSSKGSQLFRSTLRCSTGGLATDSSGSGALLHGGQTVLTAAHKARLLQQVSTALALGCSIEDLLQQCGQSQQYSMTALLRNAALQQLYQGSNSGALANCRSGSGLLSSGGTNSNLLRQSAPGGPCCSLTSNSHLTSSSGSSQGSRKAAAVGGAVCGASAVREASAFCEAITKLDRARSAGGDCQSKSLTTATCGGSDSWLQQRQASIDSNSNTTLNSYAAGDPSSCPEAVTLTDAVAVEGAMELSMMLPPMSESPQLSRRSSGVMYASTDHTDSLASPLSGHASRSPPQHPQQQQQQQLMVQPADADGSQSLARLTDDDLISSSYRGLEKYQSITTVVWPESLEGAAVGAKDLYQSEEDLERSRCLHRSQLGLRLQGDQTKVQEAEAAGYSSSGSQWECRLSRLLGLGNETGSSGPVVAAATAAAAGTLTPLSDASSPVPTMLAAATDGSPPLSAADTDADVDLVEQLPLCSCGSCCKRSQTPPKQPTPLSTNRKCRELASPFQRGQEDAAVDSGVTCPHSRVEQAKSKPQSDLQASRLSTCPVVAQFGRTRSVSNRRTSARHLPSLAAACSSANNAKGLACATAVAAAAGDACARDATDPSPQSEQTVRTMSLNRANKVGTEKALAATEAAGQRPADTTALRSIKPAAAAAASVICGVPRRITKSTSSSAAALVRQHATAPRYRASVRLTVTPLEEAWVAQPDMCPHYLSPTRAAAAAAAISAAPLNPCSPNSLAAATHTNNPCNKAYCKLDKTPLEQAGSCNTPNSSSSNLHCSGPLPGPFRSVQQTASGHLDENPEEGAENCSDTPNSSTIRSLSRASSRLDNSSRGPGIRSTVSSSSEDSPTSPRSVSYTADGPHNDTLERPPSSSNTLNISGTKSTSSRALSRANSALSSSRNSSSRTSRNPCISSTLVLHSPHTPDWQLGRTDDAASPCVCDGKLGRPDASKNSSSRASPQAKLNSKPNKRRPSSAPSFRRQTEVAPAASLPQQASAVPAVAKNSERSGAPSQSRLSMSIAIPAEPCVTISRQSSLDLAAANLATSGGRRSYSQSAHSLSLRLTTARASVDHAVLTGAEPQRADTMARPKTQVPRNATAKGLGYLTIPDPRLTLVSSDLIDHTLLHSCSLPHRTGLKQRADDRLAKPWGEPSVQQEERAPTALASSGMTSGDSSNLGPYAGGYNSPGLSSGGTPGANGSATPEASGCISPGASNGVNSVANSKVTPGASRCMRQGYSRSLDPSNVVTQRANCCMSQGSEAAGAVADGLSGILALVRQLQGNLAGLESDMHQLNGVLKRSRTADCHELEAGEAQESC